MPRGGLPADMRAAWPEVSQRYWDILGHAEHATITEQVAALGKERNQQRLNANAAAIDRLDEVLGWLLKIPEVHWRRAVAARMKIHPVSELPLNSWTNIGRAMGEHRRTVRHWVDRGVQVIVENVAAGEK